MAWSSAAGVLEQVGSWRLTVVSDDTEEEEMPGIEETLQTILDEVRSLNGRLEVLEQKTAPALPQTMTRDQAMEYLNVCGRTLQHYVETGQLPASIIGKRLRFFTADVEAFMRNKRRKKRPDALSERERAIVDKALGRSKSSGVHGSSLQKAAS